MATKTSLLDPAVLRLLRPSLPALAVATAGTTLSGLFGLAAMWQIVRLIEAPAPARVGWASGAWLCAALLAAGASCLAHAVEGRLEARVRRAVAGSLLRLPADRLAAYPTDRLRRLVTEDVAALHHMIAHLPAEAATLVAVPVCAVLLMLTLAGPVSLLTLIPGVLAGTAYLTVIPRLSARHGAELGRVMAEITTAVDDYARGIHVFRSYGAANSALADYMDAARRFTTGMLDWVRRVATPAAVAVGLLQAASSYAIAYAVGFAREPAVLAAILLMGLALVTPALRLEHGLDYVAAGRVASTRIGELLAEPVLPHGNANAVSGPGILVDSIVVSAGGRRILDGLSLTAPASAVTAVTGPSGAGKSTLLRVLAGLQPPLSGIVRVAGTDISAFPEAARPEAVLLIPQGGDVLPASIGENLRLTAPDADDQALTAALARAQLDLPLDTDAALLSGGERQRVSLARAFLAQAGAILLDEPTSALDDATATRFWGELEELARAEGKTVVAVTHDPRLALRADHVHRLAPPATPEEGDDQ
ncbi:ABC transporter [Corynebacterium striatum]|nr:ABC transporter [Corynebacterium striatum]